MFLLHNTPFPCGGERRAEMGLNVGQFCWRIFPVVISCSQVSIDTGLPTQSSVQSKPQMSLGLFLCGVKLERLLA